MSAQTTTSPRKAEASIRDRIIVGIEDAAQGS